MNKSEEQLSSDEEADHGGGGASAGGSALPSAPGGVAVGGADKGKGKGYQTRDHHKKAVGPKGDSKGKPKRRSQKFTTERKHSAVATARVYTGKNDRLDNPANWLSEECFLPTGAITNTKGQCLEVFCLNAWMLLFSVAKVYLNGPYLYFG